MEILLNLAWAVLAIFMVCLWLRTGCANGSDRRRQFIAMAVLVAILFPVISVSDDLMAVQATTEQDSLQRRDHPCPSGAHPILLFAAILAARVFDLSLGSSRFNGAPGPRLLSIDHPEFAVAGNRAPPAA